MVQAYSGDLRSRVIKAAVDGISARQAAAWFGVGASTAIVWVRRARPVVLTAVAAMLAFIPLTHSVFWSALAYVLIAGVGAGTLLTLLFLPALYALSFRVERQPAQTPRAAPGLAPPGPARRHAGASDINRHHNQVAALDGGDQDVERSFRCSNFSRAALLAAHKITSRRSALSAPLPPSERRRSGSWRPPFRHKLRATFHS